MKSTYCPKCKKPVRYDDLGVIVYAHCKRCGSWARRGERDGGRGFHWRWHVAEYRLVLYDECPSCGRQWFVDVEDRGWEGFLSLPVSTHKIVCAERTPKERMSANKRDERRWRQHPTRARIVNTVSAQPRPAGSAKKE